MLFFSKNFVCLVALSFYFPKAHILFHIICFPLLLNCHFNCHKQLNYSLCFLLIWYVQKYPSKGVNCGGILKWWKIFVSFPLQKISIFSKKRTSVFFQIHNFYLFNCIILFCHTLSFIHLDVLCLFVCMRNDHFFSSPNDCCYLFCCCCCERVHCVKYLYAKEEKNFQRNNM